MPKRKATYLVSTMKAKWMTDWGPRGKLKHAEYDPDMFKVDPRIKPSKSNPRIKTKHPHVSSKSPYYSGIGGKSLSTEWLFNTKTSARRFADNKRKQLSKKYSNYNEDLGKWF